MSILESKQKFLKVQRQGRWQDLVSQLLGRPNDLLPFDALLEALSEHEQIQRPRPEAIPLDRIAGSVGRYKDFTRSFLPRSDAMLDRWTRVDQAIESMTGVPPIEVFRIGGLYFVADGNHRVSVARANGFSTIDAYVTEIPSPLALEPGDSLDDVIIKAERARFLEETRLNLHVVPLDLYVTRPGSYGKLLEHVALHRRLMEVEPFMPAPTMEHVALAWYMRAYLPIVKAIGEQGLLRRFPGRTAADLYVWVWGYIYDTFVRSGVTVDPDEAAAMMALRAEQGAGPALTALMAVLRRAGLSVGKTPIPDWVTQTFEWGDGTLSALGEGEHDGRAG